MNNLSSFFKNYFFERTKQADEMKINRPSNSGKEGKDLLLRELKLRDIPNVGFPKSPFVPYYCLALIGSSSLFLIMFFTMAIFSKFLPKTDNLYLEFFRTDFYYSFLVPLVLIPLYFIVYTNWLSMQMFENN